MPSGQRPVDGAVRDQLEPAATDAVRAYAAPTREQADQLAAVLEDIAENGLLALFTRTDSKCSPVSTARRGPESSNDGGLMPPVMPRA
ncbi:hypothetical protein [Streptomyces sp. NPDC059224]|uniref:hypothetical protein n=1 Tax=Streptomyces sp. NPDC059224 TaxID=3346775 RepID=UPI00367A1270